MPRSPGRTGHKWRTVRAQVLAQSTTCWLCGNPGADTVDHVLEISRGGDPLDPRNLRPAHGRKIPGVCPGNYGRSKRRTTRRAAPKPNVSRPW